MLTVNGGENKSSIIGDGLDVLSEHAEAVLDQISQRVGQLVTIEAHQEYEGIYINDVDGNPIGEMYRGEFHLGDDVREHIGIELPPEYRGKGIGNLLYNFWIESGFDIPGEDFTRDSDKIPFFERLGYVPYSIINDETGEEVELDGDVPIEKIGNGYSCKLLLQ